MKTVCEKNMCTGCMACVELCPKDAVVIKDELLHYNACINETACINCGVCERVCQNNNPVPLTKPLNWYEGWAENDEIRRQASSGGVATAIMIEFVKSGGQVCSCTFENGSFCFAFADSVEEISKFTGSKYVKSNPLGIYKRVMKSLMSERKVLFIGLPCQTAALKKYVDEKNSSLLYTVDLICHGTPSPKLLETYLNNYGYEINNIKDLRFRKKTKFRLFKDGKAITRNALADRYLYSFLNSLNYTENCYSCRYATTERSSDITLGDSWGTELTEEKEKGVSLILCQTEKGIELVESSKLRLGPVDIKKAIECNKQLSAPSKKPEKRDKFFSLIQKGLNYDKIMFKCYPKVFVKQDIKKILLKFKLIH